MNGEFGSNPEKGVKKGMFKQNTQEFHWILKIRWFLLFFLFLAHSFFLGAIPLKPPADNYANWPKFDQHPGFAPYISGINFRAISDFVIDQSTEWFDPDWVQQGDILYVNVWYLEWFEQHVHDQIKYPYILISNDVGDRIPYPFGFPKILYDPKCAAWFCRGLLFSYHPKLHQLPFGQYIWYWDSSTTAMEQLKNTVKKRPFTKYHLLYMNHYPRSHGGRDKIIKLFEDAPYCFSRNRSTQPCEEYRSIDSEQYYHDLSSSYFALSPLGLETDCLRTWEALVLDCIPILEHSFNDPLYDELPVVIVHEWEEVNEQFLLEKLKQCEGCRTDKVYFDYWLRKVKETQNKIRNGDCRDSALEATQWDPQDIADLNWILEGEARRGVLVCKGFLTSAHSLQLANSLPYLFQIYLYDPWLNSEIFYRFADYLFDRSLLVNIYKVNLLTSENLFNIVVEFLHQCPVFLDLSYLRSGLCRNFNFNDCHHSLEIDIRDLYAQLGEGTMLCGNMANNEYVREVLTRISEKSGLSFRFRGNFWFLKKTKS